MPKAEITSEIIVKEGREAGPSVAIFAGIHGNEQVGVLALQELAPRLEIKRGKVYFAFANIPAIQRRVRQIDKNLNRCFFPDNKGVSYEDQRARELMAILDKCDALLDLHAFNEDAGDPFIICEENCLDIATKLDPPIISTNWVDAEPGATDGYMFRAGKVGICVECGPLAKPEQYKSLAIKTIYQFLKFYDMVDTHVSFSVSSKRIIQATKTVTRTSKEFYLDPSLRSFQPLAVGKVFGRQDDKEYIGATGDYIIFPRPLAPIGTEAFILGRELTGPDA